MSLQSVDRRDQWKLRIRLCLNGPVFYSSRTSQDKTSNAESFDSESVTSCRISGCLSVVAREITDSPLVVLVEGGVRVCGIAVLGYFWCGVAVIFISKYGIAVFRVQAVCGEFKFYVAVVGEKNVVSR